MAAWVVAAITSRAASADDTQTDPAGWTLSTNTDGIVVYTRPMPGSAYAEVRASASVCATLPELVAFVEDVARFDTWIPDTEDARLLARPSSTSQIYYIRTSMPWPVKHRDMVYQVTEVADPSAPGAISVVMVGLPRYLPDSNSAVRMDGVSGRWDFHESGGRTLITLQLHIEPGGSIPVWLARQRVVGTPRAMLRNLARQFASACPATDAAGEGAALPATN